MKYGATRFKLPLVNITENTNDADQDDGKSQVADQIEFNQLHNRLIIINPICAWLGSSSNGHREK